MPGLSIDSELGTSLDNPLELQFQHLRMLPMPQPGLEPCLTPVFQFRALRPLDLLVSMLVTNSFQDRRCNMVTLDPRLDNQVFHRVSMQLRLLQL